VRATWAPRGQTPVLTHHFNWKRLSMASALAFAPDGSDANLVFSMRAGSFNDEALIEFISELHDLLGGDKATLIWDGLTSHRSRLMKAFLTTSATGSSPNVCRPMGTTSIPSNRCGAT